MSLKFSTGVRQGMANATGIKTLFAHGAVYLFTGPQPVNADASIGSAVLVATVTASAVAFVQGSAANGVTFDAPVLGVLDKAAAETWQAVAVAAGTIGWFRLVGNPTDAGGASTSLPRIDGSVATSGADMNLPVVTVSTVGTPLSLDVFRITLPASA